MLWLTTDHIIIIINLSLFGVKYYILLMNTVKKHASRLFFMKCT